MNRILAACPTLLTAALYVAIGNAQQPPPLGAPACQNSTQTAPAGAGGASPPRTTPAPAPAELPAGETRTPPPLVWPTPPLEKGPFLIESAEPAHRALRV